MRALTLFEPWATLCVVGKKQLETRSWGTPYRGPLAIHASKTFPVWCRELYHKEPYKSALSGALPALAVNQLGCIIGTVELVACYPTNPSMWPLEYSKQEEAFGDFTHGRVMWQLTNPRRLERPIPCRGYQGIWTVPPETAMAIALQLAHAS